MGLAARYFCGCVAISVVYQVLRREVPRALFASGDRIVPPEEIDAAYARYCEEKEVLDRLERDKAMLREQVADLKKKKTIKD